MENLFKSKTFWVTTIVIAVIAFIIGTNSGKSFIGETSILLIPKSDKAVRNIDQIIANAKEIPKSLSFYNKLVELNPDMEDQASGLADAERKDFWNDKIVLKNTRRSGIIRVNVFSDSQLQAEIISKQVANDISVVMSRYYDTKNDLDIRIIDGPIVYAFKKCSFLVISLYSIILGLLAGTIIYFLVSFMGILVAQRQLALRLKNIRFPFAFNNNVPKKPEHLGREKTSFNLGLSKNEAKFQFTPVKKAAAPENLPIGSEFVMSSLKRTRQAEEQAIEKTEEVEKMREATPEEVRERLNKLLHGNL